MLKHCPNIQGYHYCDCQDDCQVRKDLAMTTEQLERGKEILIEIGNCEYEIKNINKMLEQDSKRFYLSAETNGIRYAAELDKNTFLTFLNKLKDINETEISKLKKQFNNL